MNWDWDKLEERKRRQTGFEPPRPDFDQFGEGFRKFKEIKFPMGKVVIIGLILLWLSLGFYTVKPDEVGVVLRFGAYRHTTQQGLHYHLPPPIERVIKPKVTKVRRIEVGFRSVGQEIGFRRQEKVGPVPEESLMLTGDENILDVQFIVQYRVKDPVQYLFNVSEQEETVKSAAEAAMREVIGNNKIDSALTTEKDKIQIQTRDVLQEILDRYQAGLRVTAVQLQNVHPPKEVIDAFKDVASAREDRSRYINEAQAYKNDLIPKTRGLAARYVNQAEAYKESEVLRSKGEAARFLSILKEYEKAPQVTRDRIFIEAMETVLSNQKLAKTVISNSALQKIVPYLPLDKLRPRPKAGPGAVPAAPKADTVLAPDRGEGK